MLNFTYQEKSELNSLYHFSKIEISLKMSFQFRRYDEMFNKITRKIVREINGVF